MNVETKLYLKILLITGPSQLPEVDQTMRRRAWASPTRLVVIVPDMRGMWSLCVIARKGPRVATGLARWGATTGGRA